MKKGIFLIKGSVLLAGMFFLSGCVEEIDTTDELVATITSNYSASYSEASQSGNYSAYFIDNDDGNSVELSGDSTVEIDNAAMSQQIDSSNNISYFGNNYSNIAQMHEFYFRDDGGNEFTNDFYFPALIEAVNGQSQYASLSNGYSVSWYATGNVEAGDSIRILLRSANGPSVKHIDQSAYMSGTTYFSPGEIAQLGNFVTLQFCHEQDGQSIQAEDGGTLSLKSCSRLFPVTIEQ